jgi:hypothetical protein
VKEAQVIAKFRAARLARNAAEVTLTDHFEPLVRDACERKAFSEADAIIARMPVDATTTVFMCDLVREARKKG